MTPDDFETALHGLERSVAALERGDLELAEALAAYEEGVGKLGRCLKLLDGAERRVRMLAADADGNLTAVPFDATATADPAEPAPKPRRGRRATPPPPSPSPDEPAGGA